MITKIVLILVVLVALLAVVVALQPAEFRTTRSAHVAAPPSAVFPEVDDLRRFAVWNPFGKPDPAMKLVFSGAAHGPGSVMAWAGNAQVGEGRMTITDVQPNKSVTIRLDFLKPFPSTSTAEFTFEPEADGTRVTWSMSGRRTFVPKAVGLFINLDKMIGDRFASGLAELKTIVEPR